MRICVVCVFSTTVMGKRVGIIIDMNFSVVKTVNMLSAIISSGGTTDAFVWRVSKAEVKTQIVNPIVKHGCGDVMWNAYRQIASTS